MISFPNCKINLGLNILGKREDGYHNLETVFYPIQITDALEVIQNTNHDAEVNCEFSCSGLHIDLESNKNICVKAYDLLKKDFPQLPKVKMHLHKKIPFGAGLGGGSANASFALQLLNKKFNLNISHLQLLNYALKLGSDCPFFIINKPCVAKGRGEILEEINIDLSAYYIAIINPLIKINTAWAFSRIVRNSPINDLKDVFKNPIKSWRNNLNNDFEEAIFSEYPLIKKIKDELYMHNALYASMTGSGSTVFGLFESVPKLNLPKEWFIVIIHPANN